MKIKSILINYMFIPALTSVKSGFLYNNILNFLLKTDFPTFMLSAYDIYYNIKDLPAFYELLEKNRNNRLFFLDSGGFEKGNLIEPKEWNIDLLIEIAKKVNPDIVVCYDQIGISSDDTTLEDFKETYTKLSDKKINFEVVIQNQDISQLINNFDEYSILSKYPNIYALCIPERYLGKSIENRMKNLHSFIPKFKQLVKNTNIKLHIMGCSNPSTIIKFKNLGAEIFDGIHWYDAVIEPENNQLLDYAYLGNINCQCKICEEFRLNNQINLDLLEKYYNFFVLSHNLFYYKRFVS